MEGTVGGAVGEGGRRGGRPRDVTEGAGVGPHWVERATSPQRPDWMGWLGLRRLMGLWCPVVHELTASLDGMRRPTSDAKIPLSRSFKVLTGSRPKSEVGHAED